MVDLSEYVPIEPRHYRVGTQKTVYDALAKHAPEVGISLALEPNRFAVAYLPLCINDVRSSLKLNEFDRILAPSEWMRARINALYDIRPNVEIAHIGVDTDVIKPMRRRRGAKLRFLFLASHGDQYRKGADLAKSAFSAAFGAREDVELVLHSSLPAPMLFKDASNINIAGGRRYGDEYLKYLHGFDALLHPARLEAIGLTVAEAIASGMPAIHSGATGMAEYAHVGLVCQHRSIVLRDGDEWREPYPDQLVARLREIDTDYDTIMKRTMIEAELIAQPPTPEEEAPNGDATQSGDVSDAERLSGKRKRTRVTQ